MSGPAHRTVGRVCVYAASSRSCDGAYLDAARTLGRELAVHGATVVYGGGGTGPMGRLADAALAAGGEVVGVLPRFMYDVEWGHAGLSELLLVDDIHTRKRLMLDGADAIVALPGGCGTLEELFEAITWKRLGLLTAPVVMVNVNGFFDACAELLERCIAERFMDERHRQMWTIVGSPVQVLEAIASAPPWDPGAREFALS